MTFSELLTISVSLLVKEHALCTVFHRYKDFFTKVLDFFFFKTKFTYVVLAVLEPLCRPDWP